MQQKETGFIVIALVFMLYLFSLSDFAYGVNIEPFQNCNGSINISDENIFPSPVYAGEDTIISSTIVGPNLSKTWIESSHQGLLLNYSNLANISNKYNFTISGNDLDIGEVVIYRFFVNNTCGDIYGGEVQFFVVLGTSLIISPSIPDGENGWYTVIPTVNLIYNNPGIIYYRFNSLPLNIYTLPFNGTEDPDTGGISVLRYFARDISGKDEPLREFITRVDFTEPKFMNKFPENGSILSNTSVPISVNINDFYQGNSGIDDGKIELYVDDNESEHTYESLTLNQGIVKYTANDLGNGMHKIKLIVKDFAGNTNSEEWFFTVNIDEFNIDILYPDDETVFNKRRVLFNVQVDRIIDLLEIGINGKFSKMCIDCNYFNKTRTLKEGLNNITVRAKNYGNVVEEDLQIYVDTKEPKIRKTLPLTTQVTNGSFYIKYSESNLQFIKLYYNVTNGSYITNLDNCESGDNEGCSIIIDLNQYNMDKLSYYFEISDKINIVRSKILNNILIDTDTPSIVRIEPEDNAVYGNIIPFDISSSENASISYIDHLMNKPILKNLCRNCDHIAKNITFSGGTHNVTFIVKDQAGNIGINEVSFSVLD